MHKFVFFICFKDKNINSKNILHRKSMFRHGIPEKVCDCNSAKRLLLTKSTFLNFSN